MRLLLTTVLTLLLSAGLVWNASAQPGPDELRADAPNSVLIQNATVHTVTNGTLEATDILVEDGIIAEIGTDLNAPSGVDTYDADGHHVMPGIIDAHAHIAISDVNEATSPVTAHVNVGDVLDPYDIGLYRALAGGVTTSHVMHGSANAIGGQNETIKHRYGMIHPDALRMEEAPRTIKFALGENPTRVHGEGRGIVPRTRMGVESVIREALTDAQRYRAKQEAYEAGDRSAPPEHSERLEVVADILSGDVMVHAHSYRADEILMLMDVLEDFDIDELVFQHVNEGFKVAPELADFGAGASIFADWWGFKFEVYYSTAYNAAILTRNGVTTSINSDSPDYNRHLYHQAAKAQRYGELGDDETLSLITINAAEHLGIDEYVGSIEEGKHADLAIFDAHPLSIYAVPQRTYVDGVVRFDRHDDPDDMRLRVDPESVVEETFVWENVDVRHGSCMQYEGTHLHVTESGVHLHN